MRLPRNVKMLRGPIDASALAGTVFLLWIATFMHSSLVLPPGVRLRLPDAPGIWGEVLPQLTVAVDASQPGGRLFFEHQLITESNLQARLRERTADKGSNLVLLLLADRDVTTETLARLVTLTRAAGVAEVVLGTSPRPDPAPETSPSGTLTHPQKP
jgi:biopolymer transport protein ExbD